MSELATPTTLVELIDALQPVPEPAPVSMLPQTQGWIVVAGFALVGLVWGARMAVRRWHANAYRRAALAALQGVGDDPAAVATILKRTALVAYPRAQVAGLTGAGWLQFLDRSGDMQGFAEGPGTALAGAAYRPDAGSADGVNALASQWVRRHRTETGR